MSDRVLREVVVRRLDAEARPEDTWSMLVLAALEGPEALGFLKQHGAYLEYDDEALERDTENSRLANR